MTQNYYKFHEKKISEIEEIKNFIYDSFTSRKDSVLSEIPISNCREVRKCKAWYYHKNKLFFYGEKVSLKKYDKKL
jgi:hypothetical protein